MFAFAPTTGTERPSYALTSAARACIVRAVPAVAAHPFEVVARAHQDALILFATRLCGDASEGRDVVQDAFERAFRRFDTFDPSTDARAWLFTIVHNVFIDRCRKRVRAPRTELVDDVEAPAASEEDAPPAWTEITGEELRAAVDELEPDFREVYVKHAVDGLSYQEIATALALPTNTVGTRLARARRKLRAILTRRHAGSGAAP